MTGVIILVFHHAVHAITPSHEKSVRATTDDFFFFVLGTGSAVVVYVSPFIYIYIYIIPDVGVGSRIR